LIECLAIFDDGAPIDLFLEPYISGQYPALNPIPTSFKVCYEAQDAVAAFGLSSPSTWVLIDQEGRIAYRMNDNLDPIMLEIIIDEIEHLLYPTP